jgi:hypothetical protein
MEVIELDQLEKLNITKIDAMHNVNGKFLHLSLKKKISCSLELQKIFYTPSPLKNRNTLKADKPISSLNQQKSNTSEKQKK